MPVQVNGKLRARLTVAADISEEALQALALADPHVSRISRVVGQEGHGGAGRLVSIVVS